jgi:multiple sugar transport system permease protein
MRTKSGTQRLLRWIGNGLLVVMLIWTLVPFYWMIATSLKKDKEIYGFEATLVPRHPTLDAYRLLFAKTPFVKYVRNSTIIAVATTAASLVLGCLGAYALARLRFPGRKAIARGLVFTYLVPPSLLFIPLFAVMSAFRLIDTYHGLVLAYLGFTVPFCTWLLMGYFRSVPLELEEAALVDGCSRLQALAKVAWPLAAPGIVSAAAFAFILSWTEFLFALVLTRTNSVTLPVALAGIITGFQGNQYGEAAALTMVSLIPALAIGVLIQRHLVRGLTLGAVQG